MSAKAEPGAAQDAVLVDCLHHVHRARRLEAAHRRKDGRDCTFVELQERNDELKWCGSSPLYTFLKAVPQARGELHRYEQWNIDEQSVVSFAGISFSRDRKSMAAIELK